MEKKRSESRRLHSSVEFAVVLLISGVTSSPCSILLLYSALATCWKGHFVHIYTQRSEWLKPQRRRWKFRSREKPKPPETMVKTEDKLAIFDAKVLAPFKSSKGSFDRDVALAKLEDEKRVSFIKAWEQEEKTKAENKAQKKAAEVFAWENSKKAALESKLKKQQEDLEKKKAEYGEKIKNKVATVHKQAEEKRAAVEAKRGEEFLKVEEATAKFRATNRAPPKRCGCLGA